MELLDQLNNYEVMKYNPNPSVTNVVHPFHSQEIGTRRTLLKKLPIQMFQQSPVTVTV
jgi:hypothetical protein